MATTEEKIATLINGVNVDELISTIEAVKETPTIAQFRFRVQNQWKEEAKIAQP